LDHRPGCGEVVQRPAGELAAKLSFNFGLELVEMSDDLAFFGFDQVDANGTVTQCGGQWTDAGEDGGAKALNERTAYFRSGRSTRAFVAGIGAGAQFFVLEQKSIHFIQ